MCVNFLSDSSIAWPRSDKMKKQVQYKHVLQKKENLKLLKRDTGSITDMVIWPHLCVSFQSKFGAA